MEAAAAGAERRTEENLMGALLILHEGGVRPRMIRRAAAAAGPARPAGCRVRPTYQRTARQEDKVLAFRPLPSSHPLPPTFSKRAGPDQRVHIPPLSHLPHPHHAHAHVHAGPALIGVVVGAVVAGLAGLGLAAWCGCARLLKRCGEEGVWGGQVLQLCPIEVHWWTLGGG